MKIKYGQILASTTALQNLVNQPLHLRQAYELSKMVKRVNEELDFFSQKRNEIMASKCSEEEKSKQFDDLLNFEIDWDLLPLRFKVDDDIKLSASELDSCLGMIEIEE